MKSLKACRATGGNSTSYRDQDLLKAQQGAEASKEEEKAEE